MMNEPEAHNMPPRNTQIQDDSNAGDSRSGICGKNTLNPGQHIIFKGDNGEERFGTIVSRAGKATGKYKDWYNVGYEDAHGAMKTVSVDLKSVEGLEVVSLNSREQEDVMMMTNVVFEEAKKAELESWIKHKVYESKENTGQKSISTRWICTLKEKDGKVVPKARLVARGFEELESNGIQKDSPTCACESLKVVLAVMAQHGWEPKSMDIKTAFLQGHRIEREVYFKPPKEANADGKVWLLNKCVYGLNDASLNWYKRVKGVMTKLGATVSRVDPAVFMWNDPVSSQLKGVLACHVDDFIWSGDERFENDVVDRIREEFLVGREEERTFSYVGLEISRNDAGLITLDQNKYAENIIPLVISKTRAIEKHSDITASERTDMRSKIGQILWAAQQTRPDVMFGATTLAGQVNSAQVKDLVEVNKVVKRLKTDKLTLKYHYLKGKLGLLLYTDSSLGKGAQFICIKGEGEEINPIWWSSKKICRIVRSSLAGETIALADGIDMCIFLATLYTELEEGKPCPEKLPVVCRIDCRSLYDAIQSTKETSEKRLRLEISGVKEQMQEGLVKRVEWVSSNEQLADSLQRKEHRV